jgi:DNA helicase-2/ATP-dependent DNA helicase PcrA
MTAYLDELNPEQRDAVTRVEGPLLILAGAGSGKTGVLTRRIAYLLDNGIEAEHIFAVTFTNKAAREMKERVIRLVGERGEKLWISTFHSSCARILRSDIEPLGWTPRFTIYDDDDQLRIIKEIIAELGYDPQRVVPRDVLAQIDAHKNRQSGSPDELVAQRRSHHNDPLVKIWREYSDRMHAADALDFNDLIHFTLVLFRRHPDILEKWRERFHYLMVDEYQDTNRPQYDLIRLLAGPRRNLAVVGDDDQSIYGFRGADITNILGFQDDFPEAHIIRLERNYRCSGHILAVANAVVAKNTGRMEKKLWTTAGDGHPVRLQCCGSPREEADWVARAILDLRRSGYTLQDVAIIYRTNATSRAFEAALREYRIAHRIVGGRKFYDHREVRDILGYLRLIVNPADDAAFLRVVNVPTRGIGSKTLQLLRSEAASRGEPLLKAARNALPPTTAAGKAMSAFVALIDELTDASRTLDPPYLVLRILERTGYRALFESEATAEARERLENLDELVRDAAGFEPAVEVATSLDRLQAWLDRVALAGQDDEIPEGGEVTLMTVHNSKGLEYPVVFVVHMMEGQFPHHRASESPREVEEERRLAYVAFTRAKQRLLITRSQTVVAMPRADAPVPAGSSRDAAPSRFLFGLPTQSCKGDIPVAVPEGETTVESSAEETLARLRVFRQNRLGNPMMALPPDQRTMEIEDPEALRTGAAVHHPRFGRGEVVSRLGLEAIVRFDARSTPTKVRIEGMRLLLDG